MNGFAGGVVTRPKLADEAGARQWVYLLRPDRRCSPEPECGAWLPTTEGDWVNLRTRPIAHSRHPIGSPNPVPAAARPAPARVPAQVPTRLWAPTVAALVDDLCYMIYRAA